MAKGQQDLPGVRPVHVKRLEEIQDELETIDGKIAKLRQKKTELNTEAVGIWDEHKLEPMVRGSNQWYLDEGVKKMKRRRFKVTKEDEKGKKGGDKAAEKPAADKERATA
jgi:hypothetical protein